MKVQKTPFAIAAAALCAAAPFAAEAAPTVSWRAPAAGATISQDINQTSACEVTGLRIDRVVFSIRRSGASSWTALNTEQNSPWRCNIDVSQFTTGTYTLRAQAYDSANASATTTRTINIANGTTSNTPPTLSITSPTSGQTVSGTVNCAANASDSDGITRVQFFLDGSSTALANDTTSPYTCSFNSATLTNGSHTLRAVATDSLGATQSTQVSFNVSNSTSGGGTTPPPPTSTTPTVSFSAPASGATIGSTINQSSSCQVSATTVSGRSIRQVQFFLDNTALNTEGSAPWQCNIDPRNHTNGAHVLRARATDSSGATGEAQISVNIANGIAQPAQNTPPTVSLTAPAVNATLSGTQAAYAADASDPGGAVARVDFYLVPGTQTAAATMPAPFASRTVAPYSGMLNTTTIANGSYSLMAVATDNQGATATTQRGVTVSNTSTPPPTEPPPSGGAGPTTRPANGARAVPTFESLGMYWQPGSNPGAAGCSLRYRKHSESAWREALPMWYDSRNGECRGSIVYLEPGADYAVEMGTGSNFTTGVNTRTWPENFPIARTVQVQSGSGTLAITEGGTPQGYVLYTGAATLDAGNGSDFNVTISAPYVIVRGLTLRGARRDGIRLLAGAHDVVIEDNDISEWGSPTGGTTPDGWRLGVNNDAGIGARCSSSFSLERLIVQRNRIHHPRYGANAWDDGHPRGPQGVYMSNCGGNHVMRHNEIYSEWGRYFNDGLTGAENFSNGGFPNADSDINGNRISHTWDDGIEAEGANRNVRIWGNYIDSTSVAIGTTSTSTGPVYIFRNVQNRARHLARVPTDQDERNRSLKSGSVDPYGDGARYVFHNTLLQATASGSTYPLGAGQGLSGTTGQPLTNTMSRNNIFHVWRASANSIVTQGGAGNDLDYDLRNGGILQYSGETNGIVGTPIYAPGHGPESGAGGQYQLAPHSPGYDRGARIPNFNDRYNGSAPDMGAHEAGMPAMRFGVGGSSGTAATQDTSAAATQDPSTTAAITSGGTTSGSGGGGGVCSTISCAAQ